MFSTNYNRVSLGDYVIARGYLGTVKIWGTTPGSTSPTPTPGTPVLSNFRVESANPNRVLFDSSGDISNLTQVGFIITGKTISSLTINGTSLTGHYLTVSAAFDFWQKSHTVRLENGNGTVHDFTMEHIINNIPEATSSTIRYATVSGAGSQDGTSEANAWSYAQASANASTGMTVYVKAGTSSSTFSIGNSGTSSNPIKFVGYKTTPGDNPNHTFAQDITLDGGEMPLINNASISLGSNDYIIIRNFQVQGASGDNVSGDGSGYILFDNVYSKNGGNTNWEVSSSSSTTQHHNAWINCWSGNADNSNYRVSGSYLYFENCYSATSGIPNTDYQFAIYGNSNGTNYCVLKDCTINADVNDTHSQHGYSFKPNDSQPMLYNLLVDSTCTNTKSPLQWRHNEVKYCVAKRCNFDWTGENAGSYNWEGVRINGAEYNTLESSYIHAEYPIYFLSSNEAASATTMGKGNKFINCIFDDATSNGLAFIRMEDANASNNAPENNEFINCTFDGESGIDMFSTSALNGTATGNIMDGCIIHDVPAEFLSGSTAHGFTFSNTLIWGSWTNSLGVSSINIDPVFNASYQPQALLEDIEIAKNSNVFFDKDGGERTNPTTPGAIKHSEETTLPNRKPVLSNFRIEDSDPDRLYFDSSSSISGMSTAGFYILIGSNVRANALSSLTINGNLTTGHYFTLSSSLNYWQQTIMIWLDGGNDVVYDFDKQMVYNNISEPTASIDRYVSESGGGDGTSIGSPWTLAQACSNATAGMTIHIAKGSYTGTYTVSNSGTSNSPIKFIGYGNTPGDDPSITFEKTATLSSSIMPYLNGSGTGQGFNFANKDYIIVKNLQVDDYNSCFYFDDSEYVRMHNCYADNAGDAGFDSFANYGVSQIMTSCFSRNGDGYAFHCTGRGHMYKDSWAGSNRSIHMDYHFDFQGTDDDPNSGQHIMKNLTVERDDLNTHGSHGITLYGRQLIEHCLVEDVVLNNCQQTIEARRSGTKYSVFRNITANAVNESDMAGIMINSSSFNVFDNIRINGGRYAIKFYLALSEDENATHKGEDNIIKNCVFNGATTMIQITHDGTEPLFTMNRNKIINCTFKNFTNLYRNESSTTGNDNNDIINCIVDSVTNLKDSSYTGNPEVFGYSYSNFYNNGFSTPSGTGNFSINPQLDANYEPQATFTDIDVPKDSRVPYDKNGLDPDNERADLTTIGSVKHNTE